MFSTLLIPSDLSPLPEQMIECTSSMAELGVRSIILLHALGVRHLEAMAPALAAAVEPVLREQVAALERSGLPVELMIVPGVAHKEIEKVAREHRASVLLLPSQKAALLADLRIGSVTLETLRGCQVPVLLAPSKGESCGSPGRPCRLAARRVLHPTDFSDVAEHAFAYVRALVERGVQGVTLLHVQDQGRIEGRLEHRLPEFDEIDRGRLERLARDLKAAGAGYVHIEIVYGSPAEEIVSRSIEVADCLIVMGTQGRGLVPEVFLGSVSHAVARRTSVPVLLVPARAGHVLRT
jgi:nucleotide-binding universal stress UspA family protein